MNETEIGNADIQQGAYNMHWQLKENIYDSVNKISVSYVLGYGRAEKHAKTVLGLFVFISVAFSCLC